LSLHSMSLAPRSCTAESRFTITCLCAMRTAPRASVTVTIIGRNSGVSPNASASANRNDSRSGRPNKKVHQHHEQDEQHGEPQEQHAKVANAKAECNRRRFLAQPPGDRPDPG